MSLAYPPPYAPAVLGGHPELRLTPSREVGRPVQMAGPLSGVAPIPYSGSRGGAASERRFSAELPER